MKVFGYQAFCSLLAAFLVASVTEPAKAQRAGQSVSVQYGVVTGTREVDLSSNAAPTGAVVGGTIGLVTASGKSGSKKARNTLIGTATGAAIGGASRGPRRGILYSVQMGTSGMIQVVSDQREIRLGDCVAVEQARETANIRRVAAAYCDAANKSAVQSVAESSKREAEECQQAKQQLVEADTAEAIELAARKIELLCAD